MEECAENSRAAIAGIKTACEDLLKSFPQVSETLVPAVESERQRGGTRNKSKSETGVNLPRKKKASRSIPTVQPVADPVVVNTFDRQIKTIIDDATVRTQQHPTGAALLLSTHGVFPAPTDSAREQVQKPQEAEAEKSIWSIMANTLGVK